MTSISRRRARHTRRTREGFTLLELMLVLVILVVLAGLSTFAVLRMQATGYSRAASVEVQTLADACKMYKLDVGAFPTSLNDLVIKPSGIDQGIWQGPYLEEPITADPWNRPYKYSPNDQNNQILIQSGGADGQMGGADDIANMNINGAQ
jgi:general secretion pathway protein G